MAKASNQSRKNRDSLRSQVRSVVASSQHLKKRMAAQTVRTDFGHLRKLNANDKEEASQIAKKYDQSNTEITNPELLKKIEDLANSGQDLKDIMSALSKDFSSLRKKNG